MRRVVLVLWVLLAAAAVAVGYVRLAPSDPIRWHVEIPDDTNRDFRNGAIRVLETGPDGLARLAGAIAAAPRTKLLAGSVEDGRVTWVTRTPVIGFPDYVTAEQRGDRLLVWGRARFGSSDLGVNRARVEDWLQVFQP